MSRIGKLPITIPKQVKATLSDSKLTVSGTKGELTYNLLSGIRVEIKDNLLNVYRSGETKEQKSFHGLTRALIQNMVQGVSMGYEKTLQLIGVGYNAQITGKWLNLSVGFSHEVYMEVPKHLKVEVEKAAKAKRGAGLNVVAQIKVQGISKEDVGKFAAEIRRVKPPENYKGKGKRYKGEHGIIKPGKKAAS